MKLPLKLINIYKKGKIIFLFFEQNWTIIVKLGMVGWFYTSENKPDIITSYNISFEFSNKDLYFSDFRNFGTLTFTNDNNIVNTEINKIAPDIIDNSTNFIEIYKRIENLKLENKKQNLLIEDALMDQTLIFSGIGNIIKSEVLYDSKISPLRKIKDLSKKDWNAIFLSSKKISNKILNHLYKKSLNLEGYFKLHSIYKKEVDPFGNIVKIHVTKYGRKTYWVPDIQK